MWRKRGDQARLGSTAALPHIYATPACELAGLAPLLDNDAHRSVASSGGLLTIMLVIQVVSMLVIPALLGEQLDRRVGLAATTLMLAGGLFGFAFSPATPVPPRHP